MKKTSFNLFVLAITTSILMLASCKKEEVTPTPTSNNKSLLQDKNWKMNSQKVNGLETFSTLDKCSQDDITIFNTNGKVIVDAGVLKCGSAANQQEEDGTWSLSTDGKVITHKDSFGDTLTKTILELSATTLRIEYKDLGATWLVTFAK
jgi:hypothetical protein